MLRSSIDGEAPERATAGSPKASTLFDLKDPSCRPFTPFKARSPNLLRGKEGEHGEKVVPVTRFGPGQFMQPSNGNHADFLRGRFNVDMIHGICALRSCADLPKVASFRSFNSMSFSDMPADLSEAAKLKNRSLPSPGYLTDSRHNLVAFSTAARSTVLGCAGHGARCVSR